MTVHSILLTLLALFPAIALCFYIYKKDCTEKEPLSLLVILFGLGIFSIYPAIFFEKIFGYVNDTVFSPFLLPGVTFKGYDNSHIPLIEPFYQFSKAFFVVALVEESVKWVALWLGTHSEKHFDSFFDGIIYSVFVSLGFAAFENIQYVAAYGFKTGLMRAVLSVPAHMFFSVFMGYFFSIYIVKRKAQKLDVSLNNLYAMPTPKYKIKPFSSGFLSIAIPVAVHGLYDFCLFYSTPVTTVIFALLMVFLYVFCFRKIHKVSKADSFHKSLVIKLLIKSYPGLLKQD